MTYPLPPEIQQLLSIRMASGQYESEDDALRMALVALALAEEEAGLVQAALDEWHAGDEGLPLSQAIAAIRNQAMTGQAMTGVVE